MFFYKHINTSNNNKNILWKKPSIISDKIIKDTHDASYVDLVKDSFPNKGFSSIDGDKIISAPILPRAMHISIESI